MIKKNEKNSHKAYQQALQHTKLNFGQKAADKLTEFTGSWTFIISLSIFISGWILLNLMGFVQHWDPWPFIILNLCLSCLAAIQAPIILMSQNRQAEKDRRRFEYDYAVNRKAEKEIENMQQDLDEIKELIKKLKN